MVGKVGCSGSSRHHLLALVQVAPAPQVVVAPAQGANGEHRHRLYLEVGCDPKIQLTEDRGRIPVCLPCLPLFWKRRTRQMLSVMVPGMPARGILLRARHLPGYSGGAWRTTSLRVNQSRIAFSSKQPIFSKYPKYPGCREKKPYFPESSPSCLESESRSGRRA